MPTPTPPPSPCPKFFKKKRPPSLNLTIKEGSSTSSFSSLESSPSTPISTCTTPEIKAFLSHLNTEEIENIVTYNSNCLKNGQNGVVKEVTLTIKNKIRKLVKKQGSFGVEQENKITEAIQNIPATKFPFEFFALPVAKGWDGTTNILYTTYQETGDLQAHADYIHCQYITNPSSVLSFLFQGFYQLLDAINALDGSEFKDESGKFHQGIIHNDIKPSNIFLKTDGSFILGDFGCAYFKDEAACQISTFQFSAPELFINEDFCVKSLDKLNTDLWSLGACLWYLLTHQLISPMLPNKSFCDLDKILFYKNWAENYPKQWQALIRNSLNLTGKQPIKEIKDAINKDLKNLKTYINFNNTEQKKKILKQLALLMLAPCSERPNIKELKELMTKLEDDFVIYSDIEEFAAQLLRRKRNLDPASLAMSNNKSTFSR